jgi:lipoyl(octanoyl) transferase
LHRYLRDLEGALIDALALLGAPADRVEGLTGVWTTRGKVAAIGVRVSSGWITSHGFALNVAPELGYFRTIVPCGISDREVTSLERELGAVPPMDRVQDAVAAALAARLGRTLEG